MEPKLKNVEWLTLEQAKERWPDPDVQKVKPEFVVLAFQLREEVTRWAVGTIGKIAVLLFAWFVLTR